MSVTSWLGRLGSSAKGIFTGVLLVFVAIGAVFWNEGRAVKTAKSLEEGADKVVSVEADAISSDNEGKLVHISGKTKVEGTLTDSDFFVSAEAVKLKRNVEMYQWQEVEQTTSEKDANGNTNTKTSYTYKKDWYPELIDSSKFQMTDDHKNPTTLPYESKDFVAGQVTIGAFTLSSSLIGKISNYEYFWPAEATSPASEEPTSGTDSPYASDYSSYFYDSAYESGYTAGTTTTDTTGPKEASFDGQKAYFVGKDPANPEVGDVRVTYEIVRPGTVSIIAKQSDDSFKPYKTKAGKTIEMLSIGDQDAEQMFDAAISGNKALTWGLRVFCFILMLIAVNMIFKPLSVLADPIPLLGDIAQFGIGLISFVIALALTLVAVAIAWFVYRPVLSIVLIALAVAAVYGMKQMKAGKSAVVRPTPKA